MSTTASSGGERRPVRPVKSRQITGITGLVGGVLEGAPGERFGCSELDY